VKRQLTGLVVASVIVVAFLAPFSGLYNPSSLLGLSNPIAGIWSSVFTGSYPASQTITVPGMEHNSTVIIDSYGVPHIFTQSEADLAYIMGYLHAHDRLFQMDLQRRLVEGTLSEVLGNATYSVDVLYRTLGLYRGASKVIDVLTNISQGKPISYYPQLDVSLVKDDAANVLALAQNYCNGVNAAIKWMESVNGLPVEFKLLGYTPQPWTIQNVFEMDRLITWGLTGGFDDLNLFMVEQGLVAKYGTTNGTNYLLELFPIDSKIDHFIIPDSVNSSYQVPPSDPSSDQVTLPTSMNVTGLSNILSWIDQANPLIAPIRGLVGSNDWVVGGNLTTTGEPIVCNDPHLQLSTPPVWYEVQYVTRLPNGDTINARGVSLPGIGFIILGANQYVGWGFTNVGADQIDFYYYNWNSAGQYLYKGVWTNVQEVDEPIVIKTDSGTQTVTLKLNFTVHGPLIQYGNQKFAMCWMGERYGSTEAIAIYLYTHAKNAHEFLKDTYYWQMPPQNTVFGDIYGNFGYRAAGWYVNRTYPNGQMAINISNPLTALINRLPMNGSLNNVVEWNVTHWIDANQAPTLWDPGAGYVVTANNRITNRSYPYIYDIGWEWADYYRSYRIAYDINQTISLKGKISPQDMMAIQNDVFDVPASVFIPQLITALTGHASSDAQAALTILSGWNYTMLPELAAPLIFTEWLPIFENMTFADEFIDINNTVPGFSITRDQLNTIVTSIPTSSLEALVLFDPNSHWFHNVLGANNENATIIMRESFEKAIQILKTEYGPDMSQWKFGAVHTLQINHQILSMFDYPHLSAPGYDNVIDAINSAGNGGPSMREILNLKDLNQSFNILPGGQSGSPFSVHYDDQLTMWLDGQYKQFSFPPTSSMVTNRESVLYFVPG
jgi:penicillin amidase